MAKVAIGFLLVAFVMASIKVLADPIELAVAPKGDVEERDGLGIALQYFIDEIQQDHSLNGLLEIASVPMARGEVIWSVNSGKLDFGIVDTQTLERDEHDLGLRLESIAIFNQPFLFADLNDLAVIQESWLGTVTLNQLIRFELNVHVVFWRILQIESK